MADGFQNDKSRCFIDVIAPHKSCLFWIVTLDSSRQCVMPPLHRHTSDRDVAEATLGLGLKLGRGDRHPFR